MKSNVQNFWKKKHINVFTLVIFIYKLNMLTLIRLYDAMYLPFSIIKNWTWSQSSSPFDLITLHSTSALCRRDETVFTRPITINSRPGLSLFDLKFQFMKKLIQNKSLKCCCFFSLQTCNNVAQKCRPGFRYI